MRAQYCTPCTAAHHAYTLLLLYSVYCRVHSTTINTELSLPILCCFVWWHVAEVSPFYRTIFHTYWRNWRRTIKAKVRARFRCCSKCQRCVLVHQTESAAAGAYTLLPTPNQQLQVPTPCLLGLFATINRSRCLHLAWLATIKCGWWQRLTCLVGWQPSCNAHSSEFGNEQNNRRNEKNGLVRKALSPANHVLRTPCSLASKNTNPKILGKQCPVGSKCLLRFDCQAQYTHARAANCLLHHYCACLAFPLLGPVPARSFFRGSECWLKRLLFKTVFLLEKSYEWWFRTPLAAALHCAWR